MLESVIPLFILYSFIRPVHGTSLMGPADFISAKADCERQELSLPVAVTYEEYEELLQYLSSKNINDDIWLGLYTPDKQSQYWWVGQRGRSEILLTTQWANGEPNHLPEETCVRLKHEDNYLWNTRDCTKGSEFICVNYTKSEYDFELIPDEKPYDDARKHCQDNGKDLLMIKSQRKQDQVLMLINSVTKNIGNIWIGLRYYGATSADYRKFQWIDGELLDTDNLYRETRDTECIYLDKGGNWKERDCTSPTNYICTEPFKEKDGPLISGKYRKQGSGISPYSTPLSVTTGTTLVQCSTLCHRLVSCYVYTMDGKHCRLYKNSGLDIHQVTPGTTLWKFALNN